MKTSEGSDTSNSDSRQETENRSARQTMTDHIIATLPELCDEHIELIHRFIASICVSRGRPR